MKLKMRQEYWPTAATAQLLPSCGMSCPVRLGRVAELQRSGPHPVAIRRGDGAQMKWGRHPDVSFPKGDLGERALHHGLQQPHQREGICSSCPKAPRSGLVTREQKERGSGVPGQEVLGGAQRTLPHNVREQVGAPNINLGGGCDGCWRRPGEGAGSFEEKWQCPGGWDGGS